MLTVINNKISLGLLLFTFGLSHNANANGKFTLGFTFFRQNIKTLFAPSSITPKLLPRYSSVLASQRSLPAFKFQSVRPFSANSQNSNVSIAVALMDSPLDIKHPGIEGYFDIDEMSKLNLLKEHDETFKEYKESFERSLVQCFRKMDCIRKFQTNPDQTVTINENIKSILNQGIITSLLEEVYKDLNGADIVKIAMGKFDEYLHGTAVAGILLGSSCKEVPKQYNDTKQKKLLWIPTADIDAVFRKHLDSIVSIVPDLIKYDKIVTKDPKTGEEISDQVLKVSDVQDVQKMNDYVEKLESVTPFQSNDLIDKIRFMHASTNLKVVNMSIGLPSCVFMPFTVILHKMRSRSVGDSQVENLLNRMEKVTEKFLKSEIDNIRNIFKNNPEVVFVVSVGNGGRNLDMASELNSPDNLLPIAGKNLKNVLIIGATTNDRSDSSNQLAKMSNFGENSIHVAANGVNVPSLVVGGGIKNYIGTSFSTPAVARTLSQIFKANPTLSATAAVNKFLNEYTVPLDSLKGKVEGARFHRSFD